MCASCKCNFCSMIFACSIIFVKCDVTVKDDWKNMWEEAEHSLEGKIEILCNNAGVPPKVNRIVGIGPQS